MRLRNFDERADCDPVHTEYSPDIAEDSKQISLAHDLLAGSTSTAVLYARTSVTPCITSVASYRAPTTALPPSSAACRSIRSNASARVFSQSCVSSVMFPPRMVCSLDTYTLTLHDARPTRPRK